MSCLPLAAVGLSSGKEEENPTKRRYIFEIVATLVFSNNKKPFSWWEIGFFVLNSKLRVSIS
jgi:hypothetical protein